MEHFQRDKQSTNNVGLGKARRAGELTRAFRFRAIVGTSVAVVLVASFTSQHGDGEFADRAPLEFLVRVQVLARCVEVGMSHKALHGYNIAPAFEETRCVRVPEFVEGCACDLGNVGDDL